MGRHVPRRRCVGCGRVAPKSELMRIAAPPGTGRAIHDRDGTIAGRGAYLCRGSGPDQPAAACLAEAIRRRAFARALRSPVTLDPKLVESVSR